MKRDHLSILLKMLIWFAAGLSMDIILFLAGYILVKGAPPAREPVELPALAKEAGGRFAAKAKEQGIRLSVAGEAAEVLGIPSVLEEVVYNLLENAIKYNLPGGTALVSVKKEGSEAILAVGDTGIGIP